MLQVNAIQAIDQIDYNELLQNGEARYHQFIQCGLPADANHPDGRVIELDYDIQAQQAILIDNVDGQRIYYRVAHEVRAKELIWRFYGIRRFRLTNIWCLEERRQGDPKLMSLTFPEMFQRYNLLQFDIQVRA
jgi:hypothetical protein